MKKTLFFSFLFFSFLFFQYSCTKSSEVVKEENIDFNDDAYITELNSLDVFVTDGILCFKNEASFNRAVDLLNTISSQDAKQKWETRLGFTSAATIFDNISTELTDQPYSEGLFVDYSKQYSSILKTHRIGDRFELILSVPEIFSCLINKDGVVKIGQSLSKYSLEGQYLVVDGDQQKLQKVIDTGLTDNQNTFYFQFHNEQVVERSCGSFIPNIEIINGDGNRKSTMFHTIWFNSTAGIILPGGGQSINRAYWVNLRGESRKKNIFGNWSNYKTNHDLEFDFKVELFNQSNLNNAGVNTTTLNKVHVGAVSRDNWEVVAYYTSMGYINSIPPNLAPNSDIYWSYISPNRHQTQGIYPLWNTYECN